MSVEGIDCAHPLTKTDAAYFAGQGKKFVARYVVPQSMAWKRLTKEEAQLTNDAGLDIVAVFESTANRMLKGQDAGMADAEAFLKEAALIGIPKGSGAYFACDFDVQSDQMTVVEKYMRGVAVELGKDYRSGGYGSYRFIEEMAKRNAAELFWQTYAWSGGKVSTKAHFIQYSNGHTYNGFSYDLNRTLAQDFGAWNLNAKPVISSVPTQPKTVINDTTVIDVELKNDRVRGDYAPLLDALGIPYTWHPEQKKLYIYWKKEGEKNG